MRVRFLKVKRFPHPSGPKRFSGEVVDMPDALAEAWAAAGLVEPGQPPETPGDVSLAGVSLADLPGALQGVSDRQVIELAAASDARKGAAPLYEARLAELD